MAQARALKRTLAELLADDDWRRRFDKLTVETRPKELSGPLFALLLHPTEIVAWRAAEAFGPLMARLRQDSMEAARTVARQMLWRLNEESGNMGWGAAQALGASLAANPPLADEFGRILFSYVRHLGEICHGNFLDNPHLRHGVYWAIGRLAPARPDLVWPLAAELAQVLDPATAAEGKPHHEALECHDATSRGLACWIFCRLGPPPGAESTQYIRAALAARKADTENLRVFDPEAPSGPGHMVETNVGELATRALSILDPM